MAHIGVPHEVLPGDEGVSRTTVSVFSTGVGEGDEEHAWVQTDKGHGCRECVGGFCGPFFAT